MFLDFFIKKINKIQEQPRANRIKILWLCVTISMIVVFSLWLVDFKKKLPSLITETKEQSEKLKMPSLMSSLKETFQNALDAFKTEELQKSVEEKPQEENTEKEIKPNKLPSSD